MRWLTRAVMQAWARCLFLLVPSLRCSTAALSAVPCEAGASQRRGERWVAAMQRESGLPGLGERGWSKSFTQSK
ncbi:uncharacterized protein BDZ99DRAFT_201499 [Mytilinidion resinicola]|uniref:Uncharacterized protein n=1 Tax=Mytilinidion resinicola TaxID=574789 RepID=A0A6A6Y3P3_9PEZI|nr:uncharacterized protein BDZ99DRAFT_201499 [Mytilinidion resinicola]KAF2802644.1 hypothetical protein BDZ99DRAFT_201499 [Mytilinidion resinicola]